MKMTSMNHSTHLSWHFPSTISSIMFRKVSEITHGYISRQVDDSLSGPLTLRKCPTPALWYCWMFG